MEAGQPPYGPPPAGPESSEPRIKVSNLLCLLIRHLHVIVACLSLDSVKHQKSNVIFLFTDQERNR